MKLPFKPQLLMLLCSVGILAASGVLYVKSRTPETPPPAVVAQPVTPAPPPAPPVATPTFTTSQIDQWVAPIALYPDALLSQVLMAATYPANVVQAAQWSQDNPTLQGDAAIQAVINQPWDPSVRSLVAFPSLMALMGENPQWVQNLGDAFLAQPKEVMDSVQKLRALAQQTGALTSTPQQKVSTVSAKSSTAPQSASGSTTVVSTPAPTVIKIEPADPEVVYVPSYNPTVVYGSWPTPAYPPVYLPPPPGQQFTDSLVRGLGFSLGVATTYALFSDIDWDDDDDHDHRGYDHNGDNININVNNFNRISGGRLVTKNDTVVWQHNPAFRNNLPSRDAQRQTAAKQLNQIAQRNNYRGYDTPTTTARREAAKTQFNQSTTQQKREAIQAHRDNPTAQQQRREAIKARHDNPTPQQQQRREKLQQRQSASRATALSGNDSRSPSWQAQRQRGEQSRQRLNREQRSSLREHAAERRELNRR